ncbi:hypothetical protein MMC13_006978 [Lambiella insularis]|nr:hypothetical protein [Lambiella insularis]
MASKMVWDAEADTKLLLAIIAEQPISVNHESLAGRLGCTPRAIVERLKKLKKQAGELPAPGSPATPKKRPLRSSEGEEAAAKKPRIAVPKTRKIAAPKAPKAATTKAPKAVAPKAPKATAFKAPENEETKAAVVKEEEVEAAETDEKDDVVIKAEDQDDHDEEFAGNNDETAEANLV